YARLVEENRRRGGRGPEFELLDTGVFDEDRYFDIVVEYAKVGPEDIVARIEAINRGPEPAPVHILPHLWFRNTWSWGGRPYPTPTIRPTAAAQGSVGLITDDSAVEVPKSIPVRYYLGRRTLLGPGGGALLFTDNETNAPRVFGPAAESRSLFVK